MNQDRAKVTPTVNQAIRDMLSYHPKHNNRL